jgi:hypothetical protein
MSCIRNENSQSPLSRLFVKKNSTGIPEHNISSGFASCNTAHMLCTIQDSFNETKDFEIKNGNNEIYSTEHIIFCPNVHTDSAIYRRL